MPDYKGRFHLYSNKSEFATVSELYQIHNGHPRLQNYSLTELELCGLAINIARFSYLLKKVDFDAVEDHLALMHIIKRKTEPATNRIKRLLEVYFL